MVCCVVDCPNKSTTSPKCRSFSFPSTYYSSIKLRELSKKRRQAWIKSLRITNPNPKVLNRQTVCYRHFTKGCPAKLTDETDPDWVPNQNLGEGPNKTCEVTLKRKEKVQVQQVNLYADESLEISEYECFGGNGKDYDEPNLKYEPVTSAPAVRSLNTEAQKLPLLKPKPNVQTLILDKPGTTSGRFKADNTPNRLATNPVTSSGNRTLVENEVSLEKLKFELRKKDDLIKDYQRKEEVHQSNSRATLLEFEKRAKVYELQIKKLKTKLSMHDFSFDGFKSDEAKVKNLTGLPNFAVLQRLYDVVKDDMKEQSKTKLTKFDSFVITLMKLRLDLPISYLSYVFGEHALTMSRMYRENLATMNEKIGPLVKWPDDEALLASTPNCFKEIMGEKCIVLIHFLEILIKNLNPANTKAPYMKHKIRYLFAFTPAGEIIFVSQGFGSSSSDEVIIQDSGFFDKITENYIFLSVKEMFEEKQKDDEQIQRIRQFAKNSEDKVLDILKDNFRILFNPQPANSNGEVYSEYTVRCCCALSNLQMPELLVINPKQAVAETIVVHAKPVTKKATIAATSIGEEVIEVDD